MTTQTIQSVREELEERFEKDHLGIDMYNLEYFNLGVSLAHQEIIDKIEDKLKHYSCKECSVALYLLQQELKKSLSEDKK